MSQDLEALQAFAIELALDAGKLQLEGLDRDVRIEKKSKKELVTPVDRACEDLIVRRVQERYPDHGILAEEGSSAPGSVRWIIDPIDGTSNFAARIPLFSVSIGIEVEGQPAVGVVYAPYLDELFYGHTGGGAFFRRGGETRPLRVSTTDRIEDAILATGFAYVQDQTPNNNLDNWESIKREARALRRMGSAAIDLAYVADGRFDGFWEMHLKPYDVAAGAVLIREAGGRVTDLCLTDDHWLEGQHILATNGAIHEVVHGLLSPVRPDDWVSLPPE